MAKKNGHNFVRHPVDKDDDDVYDDYNAVRT